MKPIGGIVMSRKNQGYSKVEVFEKEILEMHVNGKTHREIAEFFGFRNRIVIKSFFKRYYQKQRQLAAGIFPLRPKGRPRKDDSNHTISSDEIIKQLKMENELLRSFLQIAGRK
jgi:hypothetical protein